MDRAPFVSSLPFSPLPLLPQTSLTPFLLDSLSLSEYPSFINLTAGHSSNPNAPTSNLDPSTNDARLRIAATKAAADAAKAIRKKERERAAWRVAKGLPPMTAAELKNLETEGEVSYLILAGAILGLLLLMAFMAGMVAFAVWYVSTTRASLRDLEGGERERTKERN